MRSRVAGAASLLFLTLLFSFAGSSGIMAGGQVNSPSGFTNIANRPAATLLLPYFEVDLNDATGNTTLFAVGNASASAVLTNVTVWSDLGVPVLDFNMYLTGYDVQTINLRDILVNGILPRTASAGQDPTGAISPKGSQSQDINYASCYGILPLPALSPTLLAHIRAALTGQQSPVTGACVSRSYGGSPVARGYITVDAVSHCSLTNPGSVGYFISGGAGTATNQNVLFGDYFYLNPGQNLASADPLVHIRADATDAALSTPGSYTFYARYVGGTAADNREPLATTFGARYINRAAKDKKPQRLSPLGSKTDLVVWRDFKRTQGQFACGSAPSWFPLSQEELLAFDEQEHPELPVIPPVGPPLPGSSLIPFPAATQRVRVGGSAFPVAFNSGWLYLNLNTVVSGGVGLADPAAAQAWVSTLLSVQQNGRYDVGYRAMRFDSARDASHVIH